MSAENKTTILALATAMAKEDLPFPKNQSTVILTQILEVAFYKYIAPALLEKGNVTFEIGEGVALEVKLKTRKSAATQPRIAAGRVSLGSFLGDES